ncbi:MAG: hypothetical protein WD075_14325 [Rhodospirillales bacterium]
MTQSKEPPKLEKSATEPHRKQQRHDREAKALRENLRRRKQQLQAREKAAK